MSRQSENHSAVIFRCGLCGRGIHPGDEIHLRSIDEIVCQACADDYHQPEDDLASGEKSDYER